MMEVPDHRIHEAAQKIATRLDERFPALRCDGCGSFVLTWDVAEQGYHCSGCSHFTRTPDEVIGVTVEALEILIAAHLREILLSPDEGFGFVPPNTHEPAAVGATINNHKYQQCKCGWEQEYSDEHTDICPACKSRGCWNIAWNTDIYRPAAKEILDLIGYDVTADDNGFDAEHTVAIYLSDHYGKLQEREAK